MTEKTFTATAALPTLADIVSHVGRVLVNVDPSVTRAQVKVSTADAKGPVADAVNNTTITEQNARHETRLQINVPKVGGAGGSTIVQVGGSRFSFSGGSGVINTGTMTGAVISNGDVWVGGRQVVANGRVVAEQGTVVSGSGMGTITVEIQLPANSGVVLQTTSADLRVRGDVRTLSTHSVSGDVEAQGVHTLGGNTTSGDIIVERLDVSANVSSVSGDIEIGAYSGHLFNANTVSGDINLSATPAASGTVSVSTVSGNVTTRGARHLQVIPRTVSGRVRQH